MGSSIIKVVACCKFATRDNIMIFKFFIFLVSCTKQLQDLRDQPETDTDHSVLAEFSSVVADTQQYMIPDGEVDSTQIQESLVQPDSLLQSDSELHLDHTSQVGFYSCLIFMPPHR